MFAKIILQNVEFEKNVICFLTLLLGHPLRCVQFREETIFEAGGGIRSETESINC